MREYACTYYIEVYFAYSEGRSLCSMTTLPHSEHAARRKVYAPHYNPSHLIQFEPEVKDSVIKVVNVSGDPLAS